jgi:hypothetical protein
VLAAGAAGIVSEAVRQGRPVLLIQPNAQLLRQPLAQVAAAVLPPDVGISAWTAVDAVIEIPDGKQLPNRDLTADAVVATALALIRHGH